MARALNQISNAPSEKKNAYPQVEEIRELGAGVGKLKGRELAEACRIQVYKGQNIELLMFRRN